MDNSCLHEQMDNSCLHEQMKKNELILLLVVSGEIEQLSTENSGLFLEYINTQLKPYHDDTLLDPYTVLSSGDAIIEYEDNKEDYPDESEFYMKYYGGYKNENGDIVSQINENGIFSSYKLNHYDDEDDKQLCRSAGDMIQMILEEKISFDYILYDNKLYDKNDTKLVLPDCDEDSYFVIIKCYD